MCRARRSPDLVASTNHRTGLTLPYIVRVERGTLNRGIYDIGCCSTPPKPAWTPTAPQPQWNGKLLYTFGASTGQPRLQFRSEQNWVVAGSPAPNDDSALRLGFMVADNSLTDSLFNSNRVLNAETLMMMKSISSTPTARSSTRSATAARADRSSRTPLASIFPGLLDGIQPSCDYPDSITTGMEVGDCVLLVNFYAGRSGRR